jgi:mono/diheme cytochrome c family protein
VKLTCSIFLIWVAAAKFAFAVGGANVPPLVWDTVQMDYEAKDGQTNAVISFNFTNISPVEVSITNITTSCGCTVVKVPSLPWVLKAGADGKIDATVDLRGRYELLTETVSVEMAGASTILTLRIHIPDPALALERLANLKVAAAERQAVFRGDCARCHAQPLKGKTGLALYAAACDICHAPGWRAPMVPGLTELKHPTSAAYWRQWITQGKEGSLMPAFSTADGGPLTDAQIESLVSLLTPPAANK